MIVSRALFLYWENFQRRTLGPSLRSLGQSLIRTGFKVQGPLSLEENLVLSQRCIPISELQFPKLLNSDFIAPNCTIIGDVTTGKMSSLFFGTILRGDTCKITIGNKTIIQDNTQIINNDYGTNSEVFIGDRVIIGVNCHIDGGVKIEDNSVIGNGATLHKNVHISSGSMVAAGSVVPPETFIPSGQIFAGNPAKYLRDLKPDELEASKENSHELRELASVLVEETEKTHSEIMNDLLYKEVKNNMTSEDLLMNEVKSLTYYFDRNFKDDLGLESSTEGLGDFDNEELTRWTVGHDVFGKENLDLHYEQNMTHYPDVFKIYGENFKKYDEMRKKYENDLPQDSPNKFNFQADHIPTRPGAMRAWVNKWDPEVNNYFGQVGRQTSNYTDP